MLSLNEQAVLLKELYTIFASNRASLNVSREDILAILNLQDEARINEVFAYFCKTELGGNDLKRIWSFILEYRKMLVILYGSKVSLHITFYYLSRDRSALERMGGPKELTLTAMASSMADQEISRWWKFDEETGLHHRDEIYQILSSEMSLASLSKYPLSVLKLNIPVCMQNPSSSQAQAQVRLVAGVLREVCRCRDAMAHLKDGSFLIVLPQTKCEDGEVVVQRLEFFMKNNVELSDYTRHWGLISMSESEQKMGDLLYYLEDQLKRKTKDTENKVVICRGKMNAWRKFFLKVFS